MPKRISFRARLFWAMLMMTLTALSLPLIYIWSTLDRDFLKDVETQTLRETKLAGMLVEEHSTRLKYLTECLSELDLRLTLLSPEGKVIEDSGFDAETLDSLDNHADRPEIREALASGQGLSIRHSNTLEKYLIYTAVRLKNGNVLRMSIPYAGLKSQINAKISAFSIVVGFSGILSLLLALILSSWLKDSLSGMVEVVRAISLGRYHRRLRDIPGIEFAALAEAVNRMAENIEDSVRIAADQTAQLEGILDTMNDGVLVLGASGSIRRWNRAISESFPLSVVSEGCQVVEVIPVPRLQEEVEELLATSLSEMPNAVRLERHLQIECPSGHFIDVSLSRPLQDTPDMGIVAVFHDITDLVRLERVRRDFVANVSHELRTPLTSIQGYAETLAGMDELPEECRRFSEIIRKHGRYLARMIEELLALARLENDDIPLVKGSCDPHESLRTALSFCEEALHERMVQVVEELPETVRVVASPTHLAQVFRNLLENAARFAPKGSSIRVLAAIQGTEVLFTVSDQGPGIPATDLGRIFERFYRVEKHRGASSTGLGLAICKHIIERHGGRIWAESPGREASTVFSFTLPLDSENQA